MMKHVIRTTASMVLAASGLVLAQQRVDLSGANDASNQVGSGGRIIVNERPKAWQYANDIVTGNVTGGKQFRGNIASGDPFAFRASTGFANLDRFVRGSSGVTTSGVGSYNANETKSFYGESRNAPTPDGFQQIAGAGGYVPPKPSNWRTVDPRVGNVNDTTNFVYRPDLYGTAGAVELQAAPLAVAVPSSVKASQLDPVNLSDYTQLNRNLSSQFSGAQLQQIQSELTNKAGVQFPDSPSQTTPNTNQMITKPLDSATDDSVKNGPLSNMIDQTQTQLGTRTTVVVTAAEQAKQDQQAALHPDQPGASQGPDATNEDAARKFNQEMQARKAADAGQNPNGNAAVGNVGAGAAGANKQPAATDKKPEPKMPELAPIKVGEERKTAVNEMIQTAESQMREGKFAMAIDTFDAASKLAPRDMRIRLGQAHAELGGGYYRFAEMHLKQLFTFDKTLLASQYDLRNTLGENRLQVIEKDLKENLQKNEKDAGPAFLLAYLYYNTANERRAAALVEIADKRTGGSDPFVKILKDNWNLPKVDGDNK